VADLKIGKITMGMCQTNCYFLYREGSSDVIFIDPADSGKYIVEKLKEKGFEIKAILLTHGHFDHIMGCNEMRDLTGAKIYAPAPEKVLLNDAYVNVSAQWARPYTLDADEYFEDGQILDFGFVKCKCIITPGHTIGSSCFYFEEDKILVCGDTLFYESVGRTDLPTGSMSKQVRSIKEKLFTLPDDTRVYPGHGISTDIAHEKENNPCV
jgi:glyoxylase-like metal-dependent hydrolase (beta-lactamase superfamily II)